MLLEDLIILVVKIVEKQVQHPVSMDRKVPHFPRIYNVEVLHSMLDIVIILHDCITNNHSMDVSEY